MPKLTDLFIEKLPLSNDRVTHWDTLLPAFGIRCGSRVKSFIVIDSSGSRRTLGHYPAMKLSQARDQARTMMSGVIARPDAFSDVLQSYVDRHLLPNCRPANARELERILRKDFVFNGPIAGITKRDVLEQIQRIQAPSAANHATVAIKMLFSWAEDRGHIDVNPIAKLRKPFAEQSRTRALSLQELPKVWHAAGQLGQFGLIFRLSILTGQRKKQLARFQQLWLREDHIVFPASVMKAKQDFLFPFTDLTLPLFKQLTGRQNTWSKPKRKLDALSGCSGYTIHDSRRLFSTIHGEIGTEPHLIRRLLAHSAQSIDGVTAIYLRHSFLPQMRQALHHYEQRLVELIEAH